MAKTRRPGNRPLLRKGSIQAGLSRSAKRKAPATRAGARKGGKVRIHHHTPAP
ncbi:hypothetical protein [Cohnella pontilimi]|uniref:hypothetical protein n=1 Tax=Cohnella pontilimi TaxID=2564100 RepID=UPI00145F32BA|nr:hypothetical protein [Cohnella pontilimi]